ncbi:MULTISPECIES: hypothetical protein [unclassified Sphingopyxis]|jgi:predicted secreted protein|uniref:hypothetical protein n=1 Tax=unclassified Sphingopyxis TaxID=2614943 RepID=UPI0006BF773F|nr:MULTISPECIES: hypothetical protein [unclassified Sphingopyxis]USI75939.1 hypothetical protein KEC45_14335 [Sphingopyxis sp. USTB-05]GAO77395.1 hypothetical protein SC1_00685 [Sphingopyxis sp. C-1]
MTRALRLIFLSLLMLCASLAVPARAEVVVSFYSHDFGDRFPHAFIVVKGTLDATGEVVDTNYGFTAVSVSPAILLGSVKGKVESSKADYIAKSDRQFDVSVDDATYARVMAKVAEWRDREQPSYSLNKRNCVHFVMELAEVVGLKVDRKSKLFKKPKSFLIEVKGMNPQLG